MLGYQLNLFSEKFVENKKPDILPMAINKNNFTPKTLSDK